MNEKELVTFVGQRIREERKKRKLTQKELGNRVGVKHNTIATYEAGRNAPEQTIIFKIAQALDVKVDDLFPSMEGTKRTDDLTRALQMTEGLDIKDIDFLNQLIEKALSMEETEREKFLESIKFTVDYHEKMNN